MYKHTAKTNNGKKIAVVPTGLKKASQPQKEAFTPALDIHVKSAVTKPENTPSELSEFLQEVREHKYKLRAQIGEVLFNKLGKSSVLACGRYRTSAELKNIPVVKNTHGSVSYHGLQTCKSVWCCPVCSFKISAKRAAELQLMFEAAINKGYKLGFLTLTLPHNKKEALSGLQKTLLQSWRNITGKTAYKGQAKYKGSASDHSIKNRYGIGGFVRAYETKYGFKNGWHPHLHLVLAFDKLPVHSDTGYPYLPETLGEELINLWYDEVYKNSGKEVQKKLSCKFEVVSSLENLSEYMAKGGKWTLAKELTYANEKTDSQHNEKHKNYTPFELIEEHLKAPETNTEHLSRFLEYASATKGKSSLFVSDSFKTLFAPAEQLSDEQICEEEIDTILLEVEALLHQSFVQKYIDGEFLNVIEYKPDTITAFMDKHYRNRYIITQTESGTPLLTYSEDTREEIKAQKARNKQQHNLKQLPSSYLKKTLAD